MSSIEDTIASMLDAKLEPLIRSNRELVAEVERIRRALPAPLVSVTKAAKALQLDPRTVRRGIESGDIPARRVGKKLLVDLAAVQHPPKDDEVARLCPISDP
jgi:excisionase family DNA binding protein